MLALTIGLMAASAAAAQADATWTGASKSPQWSTASNWTGATPPTTANTAAGTLTFPELRTCGTCYATTANVTGTSASGLVFGNTTGQYQILGDGFTVGSGGISNAQGGSTGNLIKAPLAVSGASQTWTVGSKANGYNSFTVLGGITGPTTTAITVSTPKGDLFVDSNLEAGPVVSDGPGALHVGAAPGSNRPGSINATDGQSLTIDGGSLVINPGSTSGALTVNRGTLLLGTNPQNNGTTSLQVSGSATLGSATTTKTFINADGSTPATDFSQVSATAAITIGGQLIVDQGPNNGTCETLSPGDVATLLTTSGGLSGTYANAPQNATLTMASSCESTPPKVQIHYTANSVTATVLGGGTGTTATTTTLATPTPSPASTNQTVTLTATVSTSGGPAPSGTVAFSAGQTTIPGCTRQPVTVSGSSATATCSTSFAASSSPVSLSAAFTAASGTGQMGSSSSAQSLTVGRGSSTTGLAVSNTSPPVNGKVTYTATVTPAAPGTPASGAVAFQDAGSTISGCAAQTLTPGSSSSTATCTVSYPATGTHSITVVYGGDGNFTGSTSAATTVTVAAAATFPTTPVLDTFAQSPGPLSANWQTPALQDAGTVGVVTSGETSSGGGAASATWKATSFGANQEAYLTVPVLPGAGGYVQIGGRVSSLTASKTSMYFVRVTPSKGLWDLRKKLNGGSSTSMGTFTAPFAAGDSAGIQLNGSTIAAWHESGGSWTSVGSVTDSSITAGGYVTFTLGDTTVRGGAFGGGASS